MKKSVSGGLLVLALLAVGGYIAWHGYRQQNRVTIVFSDAKGLAPDAGVWMAGLEIGKVEQLRIAADGVEVIVFIKPESRKQLTDRALFVIDPGPANNGPPVVRIKAGSPGGGPLQGDTRIKGMNSMALWEVADFPEKLREFMNEPQVKDSIRRLDELGQDLQKQRTGK